MEKYFVVFLLQAVILALSFQSGDSIKCYVCNSNSDENCKDPINTNEIEATDCSNSGISELFETLNKGLKGLSNQMGTDLKGVHLSFACQKIVASDDKGKSGTVRTCTMAKSAGVDPCSLTNEVETILQGKVKIQYCGTCDSDYCNGAGKHSSSLLYLILIPSLAVILSSYFSV